MKISIKHRLKAQIAFTLVDVMVAMGVLGIVLLSLFASFSFGFGVIKNSREDLHATQLLLEKMETIRLYTWEQLTQQTNFLPTKFYERFGNNSNFFNGDILVTNVNLTENYSTNLRRVMVSVNWTNNSAKRTRSISTYVSHYGMQQYIWKMQ